MKASRLSYLSKKAYIPLFAVIFFLSSCAPMESQGQGSKPDYNETKTMVLDILRTEDGKKAIKEVLEQEETKRELILSEPIVQKTIQETLQDPENKKKMQMLMADPKFRQAYAKQLEDENKALIKDLMKDPEYRRSMMEILKDPEMEKQFLEITKSTEFRKQTMSVMKEALESPYFRLELLELLSQVAKDLEGKGGQEQGKSGGGGDSGGGGGGGDSGSGGGS